jgi:mannose-6-phosphate isomerase-like protein (cupin superfamily)
MDDVITGEGWAATHLDRLGEGPGFRKIRPALGVTAFGINAIVLPPGIETGRHFHDRQQEVYFLHAGRIEMEFGDGERQLLEPGGIARVDPSTVRKIRNVGDGDAVYVIVGGDGGYVGRDGRVPDEDEERYRAMS